jgi:hypothetical protein
MAENTVTQTKQTNTAFHPHVFFSMATFLLVFEINMYTFLSH